MRESDLNFLQELNPTRLWGYTQESVDYYCRWIVNGIDQYRLISFLFLQSIGRTPRILYRERECMSVSPSVSPCRERTYRRINSVNAIEGGLVGEAPNQMSGLPLELVRRSPGMSGIWAWSYLSINVS